MSSIPPSCRFHKRRDQVPRLRLYLAPYRTEEDCLSSRCLKSHSHAWKCTHGYQANYVCTQERRAPVTIRAARTTAISSALTTPVLASLGALEDEDVTGAGTHPLGVSSAVTITNATSLIISDIDILLSDWESTTSDC
ncbi:hypothetical protein JB92DRAFT_2830998 [Gautieria morchelliformis]|nr:hypothetical protein JB92DRAFT_2830998 [Gautieria morchelliformis]